jgi:hypothetical protein
VAEFPRKGCSEQIGRWRNGCAQTLRYPGFDSHTPAWLFVKRLCFRVLVVQNGLVSLGRRIKHQG